jgi:hypothetical protein
MTSGDDPCRGVRPDGGRSLPAPRCSRDRIPFDRLQDFVVSLIHRPWLPILDEHCYWLGRSVDDSQERRPRRAQLGGRAVSGLVQSI